jgi:hypothetical protein
VKGIADTVTPHAQNVAARIPLTIEMDTPVAKAATIHDRIGSDGFSLIEKEHYA